MDKAEAGRIGVFYSYAHEDEPFRQQLERHLASLRREDVIDEWHDRRIVPGEAWDREIHRHLSCAKIVLFLVSPDLLASGYCMGVEAERAMELHWQRRCRIVPVIIRPVDWTDTAFHSFQVLPRDGRPIALWEDPEEAYSDVADGIRTVCKDIVDWENPYRRASVGDWYEIEQTYLLKQTGQQMVVGVRTEVIAKNEQSVTVRGQTTLNGQPQEDLPDLTLSLGEPLEDNIGATMKQVGTQVPPNAQMERSELGRGEQKLIVGGKAYYCTWTGVEIIFTVGFERVACSGRTWRCIDVPTDGVVKLEIEAPDFRMSQVLLDYGWGHP
jgi:hypothetical protein